MVRHFGPLCLLLVSDHDLGKLIDGDRTAGDGALHLRMDVLCALHHGDHIGCFELAGWSDRKLYVGCAF
jgi:hypothetical protein